MEELACAERLKHLLYNQNKHSEHLTQPILLRTTNTTYTKLYMNYQY